MCFYLGFVKVEKTEAFFLRGGIDKGAKKLAEILILSKTLIINGHIILSKVSLDRSEVRRQYPHSLNVVEL